MKETTKAEVFETNQSTSNDSILDLFCTESTSCCTEGMQIISPYARNDSK